MALRRVAYDQSTTVQAKGRLITHEPPFLKRIIRNLINADSDVVQKICEKRLDELYHVLYCMEILRNPDVDRIGSHAFRAAAAVMLQAQARHEWDFPHYLNPMTTRELSFDNEIPSFDDDTVVSLDSKLKTSRFISRRPLQCPDRKGMVLALQTFPPQGLTPLQELSHVQSALDALNEEMLDSLCVLGPKRMLIDQGPTTTSWALLYVSTMSEKDISCSLMPKQTLRTQVWRLETYPPGTPANSEGPPDLDTIKAHVDQYSKNVIVEDHYVTVKVKSPDSDESKFETRRRIGHYELTATTLKPHDELESPLRLFAVGHPCTVPSELSIRPYTPEHVWTANVKGKDVVVIRMRLGDDQPYNFEASAQLGCAVHGDVLVFPLKAVNHRVLVHLGLEPEQSQPSRLAKTLDAILFMTQADKKTDTRRVFNAQVKEGLLGYVAGDHEHPERSTPDRIVEADCNGLQLLPKLLFSLDMLDDIDSGAFEQWMKDHAAAHPTE